MSRESAPKRKAKEVDVPKPGQDPAERKRVLNILAQRRYRQRKKDHYKKLEAHANSPPFESVVPTSTKRPKPIVDLVQNRPTPPSSTEGSSEVDLDIASSCTTVSTAASRLFGVTPAFVSPTDLPADPSLLTHDDQDTYETTIAPPDWTVSGENSDLQTIWDASMFLPSLPSTPQSLLGDTRPVTEVTTPATSLSSISSSHRRHERDVLGASQQEHLARFDFPDEANFKMLELDLLRAGMSIAKSMHIDDLIWQLTAQSPYTDKSLANMSFDHLPVNLRPTRVQFTVPHHPFFDLLPWPTVRNKLILVFSQEPELRPPQAASPTAMLDLVYDIEDSVEGVRIWGSDSHSDRNWEVGEKVFQKWWWAFDTDIISRSNQMRRERGATLLGAGQVLGEVH